jgi:O-antigen ligase
MRTIAYWLSLVLIFTIPWEVVVEYPALGSASRIVGLAAAAFWAVTVVVTGRLRFPGLLHFTLFLFVLWNAVSIFWSADANMTMERLGTWIQLFVMIYILWDLYTTRAAVMAGLQMYILGGYVALGNTIVNYVSGNTFYYQRFSAAGTNPDDLGIFLALGIPVACYLALSKSTYKMNRLLKFVNYAYIPAALLGIALSGTRTALIATIPGIVFGLASLTRLRLWTRIAIFMLLISAGLALLPLVPLASLQRLGTTGTEFAGGDLNGRKTIWREGLASFAEHPLIGVGSNMYRSVNSVGKVAHNTFISVLVELGLIGFGLFLMILTIVIIQALRQAKWRSRFWLSLLVTWGIGASTLTLEYRKPTWLFLSLIVASAAIKSQGDKTVPLVWRNEPEAQALPYTKHNKWPQAEPEKSFDV